MLNFKISEKDHNTLIFSSLFVTDEDISYAYYHRFNVILTETSSGETFRLIHKFLKRGYTIQVLEIPQKMNNLELAPKLYAKFIFPETILNEE